MKMNLFERMKPALLPLRISERIYTSKRDIDVDYDSLDYQIHVPTYNEEHYIEETLESLASQEPVKNGDVELIVVDSHSTDKTRRIAKQYADRVLLAPTGILTARNYGLEKESADVILSADAGDVYSSGWVEEHAKAFENDNVVASYGTIYSKEWPFNRTQKIKHSIVNTWNLPGNNSAVRVSALEDLGKFYTDLNEQELIEVLLEEQIFKKIELSLEGDIVCRPYAAMYKSQRRKKFSKEKFEDYARQQNQGERF